MTKTELIAAVAEKSGLTKKEAEKAVTAAFGTISDALAKGDKVQLVGFGTFEVRERAERVCFNPRTKEPVKVDACKAPAFKAGKALKDLVK